ncbi:hypothetical protein SELMODRAFT_424831 [Selaginella moellendorffii]|uniref:Uncharacterized protein n=1 Tax=Selaginella moellendorffii TaxID=88036 RepID=D8SR56_SELML|nr:hypothetical protein SELMODRAFT_424831 [Selaginella moellendorffii]
MGDEALLMDEAFFDQILCSDGFEEGREGFEDENAAVWPKFSQESSHGVFPFPLVKRKLVVPDVCGESTMRKDSNCRRRGKYHCSRRLPGKKIVAKKLLTEPRLEQEVDRNFSDKKKGSQRQALITRYEAKNKRNSVNDHKSSSGDNKSSSGDWQEIKRSFYVARRALERRHLHKFLVCDDRTASFRTKTLDALQIETVTGDSKPNCLITAEAKAVSGNDNNDKNVQTSKKEDCHLSTV